METPTDLLTGLLHLSGVHVDASGHRAWLADRGVLAAMDVGPDGGPTGPVRFTLALREGRPLVVSGDGTLATPWSVLQLLTDLTTDRGGLVEVPEFQEFIGDQSIEATALPGPTGVHTVLLSRVTEVGQPSFTVDSTVGLLAGAQDGWSIVRFQREVPDVGRDWSRDELPAVWLRADRTLALQTAPGPRPQVVLQHLPSPPVVDLPAADPSQDLSGEYASALAALRDPQLSANSEMRLLTQEQDVLGELDLVVVADALQSAPDEYWSARVLESLGLPRIAADVAEGRAEVPAVDDSALGTWRAVRDLDRAADRDPAAGRWTRRFYGTSSRHPLLALSTIVPEILIGIALLITLVTADTHLWWHWLVGLFALGCLVDAVVDTAMMVTRLRRRR